MKEGCDSIANGAACGLHLNSFRHVEESPIGLLLIEKIPIRSFRLRRDFVFRHCVFQRGAVSEEKIHPSIVVEVKDTDATAHRFK